MTGESWLKNMHDLWLFGHVTGGVGRLMVNELSLVTVAGNDDAEEPVNK